MHAELLRSSNARGRRQLYPTGEITSVAGSPYDFTADAARSATPSGTTYDNELRDRADALDVRTGLAHAATVRSPQEPAWTLELHTDQPGVQFYDASKLNCPVPGLGGVHYGATWRPLPSNAQLLPRRAEPDRYFPSAVLQARPDATTRVSEYRFA